MAHADGRAWDAALDNAMHRLEEAALSRAIHGVARPIFYHGEQVGEWREYDERLAMFLLRYRRRHRFTEPFAQPEALRPPGMEGTEPNDDEAMGRLEWYLDELTDDAAPPGLTAFPSRAGESGNFGNFDPDCEADCDAVAPPVEPRP